MTQYTGFNMTAVFGGTTFKCLSSADLDMTADVYTAVCAGQSWKSRVTGASDATVTLNYMFDTTGHAELTASLPGVTGTFTLTTNGTYGPVVVMAAVVESHRMSSPTDGFVVGTLTLGVDASLTVS
jgi:hypothetical protein